MTLNKNVYLVLTEYQFLQALNISTSIYNNPSEVNCIYVVRNGKRFKSIDDSSNWSLNNIQIIILDNIKPKEVSQKIIAENPVHFFFFQGGSALNVFIAHTLSKKGVEISLGPDGYGPYGIFNKRFHFLSIIIDSFKQNKFLLKNNLFSGKFHIFDYYKYGNHKFIDNLWITHPDQYKHLAKNSPKIIKLPIFSEKCVNFVKDFFDFKQDFPLNDVIYFFNQPLWDDVVETEYNFLKNVINTFPGKIIIIKLHPLTDTKVKELYEKLPQVQIIQSGVPAEVILLSLRGCIVFTGWSAVLITENMTCNYYFTYPVFKELNNPIINQINIINLKHIKMILSPTEMEFPNG